MDAAELTQLLKQTAQQLGFDHCRVLPVDQAPHADFFEAWVAAGRPGDMGYLARYQDRRRDPRLLALPPEGAPASQHDQPDISFRSLIVLGVNYHQFDLPPEVLDDPSRGIIARYAWGDDYHELIRPLLYELDATARRHSGRISLGKGLVDTGPVLERDWAHVAGIGFTGKNCCTIHPQQGSWFILATLLLPEQLVYDPPVVKHPEPPPAAVLAGLPPAEDYGTWVLPLTPAGEATQATQRGTCGRCTRCLDACPTNAFVGPYHLDPQRCISYWTIETQAPIPRPLRGRFGNRIFGCDICQEVCPWNQRLGERRPRLAQLAAQAGRVAPPLLEGFAPETPYWLDDGAFAARFRKSPAKRAKRRGMARNVCVALGNWGDPQALPALTLALMDPAPVVRGHAAWALGRIMQQHHLPAAAEALDAALARETDETVREEIAAARQGDVAG